MRSFSKGYALAGLRFGYGLGHRDLIVALDKARDSYNTDAVSQQAAATALRHRDVAERSWHAVIAERARMTKALTAQSYAVFPSQSNFILVRPPQDTGKDAAEIFRKLKERGIYVRYFDQEGLADKLRITIGTPEQNEALLQALPGL